MARFWLKRHEFEIGPTHSLLRSFDSQFAGNILPLYFMKQTDDPQVSKAVLHQTPSPAGAPPRILVVDDDSAMRRLNKEVLLAYGYAVDSAEDGVVAWNLLQLNKYDLLLTDNSMPNMSGIVLLQKLHAIGLVLPVIMATGTPLEKKIDEPERLEPAVVLLKPYAYDELVKAVENVLSTAVPM